MAEVTELVRIALVWKTGTRSIRDHFEAADPDLDDLAALRAAVHDELAADPLSPRPLLTQTKWPGHRPPRLRPHSPQFWITWGLTVGRADAEAAPVGGTKDCAAAQVHSVGWGIAACVIALAPKTSPWSSRAWE
jgi:hypothetical protein